MQKFFVEENQIENDKIVSVDKVIRKYKLSTEKREIIIDRTNKKVKTRKK